MKHGISILSSRSMNQMTTRTLVCAILVLVLLASLRSVSSNPNTATPIQHVIVLVQENHSFDNYFGTYPTANGTLDLKDLPLQRVNGIPNHVCLPYSGSCISPRLADGTPPANPVEGQLVYEMDYANNGSGFATNSGPQSVVYFDYHSVAGYWDYAEEYGLGDNYYSAVLGTTTPNRLMLLTGNTPVSANYGPPPYIPYAETVMGQMDNAGVSWGYYDYLDPYSGTADVYPLNYTSDMPSRALGNVRNIVELTQELAAGSGLPSVAFVNSLGSHGLDEHPPYDPTTGELWAISIVNEVMNSVYWPTTAIFITWDEGGGYYDHVTPPKIFSLDDGFTHPLLGLGQRVPLLVISPFSREGYVSSVVMSHLSLLHFIEYNWGMVPVNGLVGAANLPLDFFDFSQAVRPPIILGSPVTYPIPLQSLLRLPLPSLGVQYLLTGGLIALLVILALRRVRPSFSRTDRERLKQPRQELQSAIREGRAMLN